MGHLDLQLVDRRVMVRYCEYMKTLTRCAVASTTEMVNRANCRILSISTQYGSNSSSLHLLLAPILALAMLLWLLHPYACCPRETMAKASVIIRITVKCQLPETGGGAQMGSEQSAQSKTTICNPLAKETPRSLPDSGRYLPTPVFSEHDQDFWVIAIILVNEQPASVIVPTPKYPPRV